MPLSTSSSDKTNLDQQDNNLNELNRHVPDLPWGRTLIVMAVFSILTLGAWEIKVRSMMYGPSINDTPGLWAIAMNGLKKDADNNPIAIVGASRIRFDLDHDILSEAFDDRPVYNLSMNGSVAPPVLNILAEDESFKGTVLLGYTPGLFWTPGGPNIDRTMKFVEPYGKQTPAAKIGQFLVLGPESILAFLQKDDLALGKLLETNIPLKNRDGVMVPPREPPYLARVAIDRQEYMWERLETDPAFQKEIQGIWQVLFSFGKPLPPDLLAKLRAGVVADIQKIKDRGGEVILVRFPSTGWIRDYENEVNPREIYWEPLLEEADVLGIHFEDYEELSGFECPEWSHLTREDAQEFSRRLMPILQDELAKQE